MIFFSVFIVENGPAPHSGVGIQTMGQTPLLFGAVVSLKHVATSHYLHSHILKYTHFGTSGQQQVTALNGFSNDDEWVINEAQGYPSSGRVQNGSIITLKHVTTSANLHSHPSHKSPVSTQQEITCFTGNDDNDYWKVEALSNVVSPGSQIRLIHLNTNAALHSHPLQFEVSSNNFQQEVTAFNGRDENDFWVIDTA